ncbi:MAG: hypothetical protein JWN22_2849 [Nocardioides sp.]|nr:hypothetical protein [Nocardioides sp.]
MDYAALETYERGRDPRPAPSSRTRACPLDSPIPADRRGRVLPDATRRTPSAAPLCAFASPRSSMRRTPTRATNALRSFVVTRPGPGTAPCPTATPPPATTTTTECIAFCCRTTRVRIELGPERFGRTALTVENRAASRRLRCLHPVGALEGWISWTGRRCWPPLRRTGRRSMGVRQASWAARETIAVICHGLEANSPLRRAARCGPRVLSRSGSAQPRVAQ